MLAETGKTLAIKMEHDNNSWWFDLISLIICLFAYSIRIRIEVTKKALKFNTVIVYFHFSLSQR